ncbi:ROK family transcriptional regulator [Mycolicibacterium fallax]|uniref:Uncharacterized protein n=1 Tax=Mycolicibacterium fallax TaxID=1793 RepID=A0A1X1RDK6_MYCFA|nr:hypothetical protein AWC04_11325 [Mycolicibacterium fallax]BBY98781.1 transcriptional regulator [Mycolicibacterium fallax]
MRTAILSPVSTPASPIRLHPPRSRHRIVTPSLRVASSATAVVFGAARARGPIGRDDIARATGLSAATVNRQVAALLEAELLRERADLAAAGAIGRPRIPVEVNHEPYLTLGIHIGVRATSIVATDLRGRALDTVEIPTPHGDQRAALAAVAASARRYLSRWRRRRTLAVGVTIGGSVDSAAGYVDHPRLGWTQAPVGPVLAEALGLPVSVATHVDAMAAAELLLGQRAAPSESDTRLYVYARDTVGYALVIGGRVHSPAGGPGTIATLPVTSELLGGNGTLASTVIDEAVLAAARRAGVTLPAAAGPGAVLAPLLAAARAGDDTATSLLQERARVLGRAIGLLSDLLNPDELIVGGQAFTDYPEGLAALAEAYAGRGAPGPREIRVSAFGARVQEAGAGIVSLGALYTDPLRALRRVG